jgi:hypothetical protein
MAVAGAKPFVKVEWSFRWSVSPKDLEQTRTMAS